MFRIGVCLLFVVSSMSGRGDCPLPLAISTDFPGGNIVVESQTEGEVRVRPDTRTSRGECAPRHWAFRVRGAGGRKVKFRFPHDPIFGFLSIRGPAVSQDEGVTWKWMTDGEPNNPSESFEYAFGPDENNVLFAWQPLYTEATLHRFVERINRGGAKICPPDGGGPALHPFLPNTQVPRPDAFAPVARRRRQSAWRESLLP